MVVIEFTEIKEMMTLYHKNEIIGITIATSLANFNHLEASVGLHGHQGSSSRVEVADSSAYYRADVSVLLFNLSKSYTHENIEIYCSAHYSADVPIPGFDIFRIY